MLHLTAPQLPDESVPIVRVHNGLSANKGGRIWCQPLDDTLTPCSCGWQPGQVHYRRKLRRALPPELSASPRSRTRADPRLKFAKLAFADLRLFLAHEPHKPPASAMVNLPSATLMISMSFGDQGNGGGSQHQHDHAVPFMRHQNQPPHVVHCVRVSAMAARFWSDRRRPRRKVETPHLADHAAAGHAKAAGDLVHAQTLVPHGAQALPTLLRPQRLAVGCSGRADHDLTDPLAR